MHQLNKTSTAWDLHIDNADTANVVFLEHMTEFIYIDLCIIQLGAADKESLSIHEAPMKIPISKRSTVSGDEQISAIEIRSIRGDEHYLDRPVAQSGSHRP